jgi:hypothetical protein
LRNDNVEKKIKFVLNADNKDSEDWNKAIIKEIDNVVCHTQQGLTISAKGDKEDSSIGESECDHEPANISLILFNLCNVQQAIKNLRFQQPNIPIGYVSDCDDSC